MNNLIKSKGKYDKNTDVQFIYKLISLMGWKSSVFITDVSRLVNI